MPCDFTLFCAFRTSCLPSQFRFLKQPLTNTLTWKPNALCRMPSYDTYWYAYAKPYCSFPRLSRCTCLSYGSVLRTISSSYAEHMNWSCPGITPSARRGEGTWDWTLPLLTSSESVKPRTIQRNVFSFLILLISSFPPQNINLSHPVLLSWTASFGGWKGPSK